MTRLPSKAMRSTPLMVLALLAAAAAATAAAAASSSATLAPAHFGKGGTGGDGRSTSSSARTCQAWGAGSACTKCSLSSSSSSHKSKNKKQATCLACSTGPVDSILVDGRCTCPPGSARTNTPNTLAPPPTTKGKKRATTTPTCSPCAPDSYIGEQQLVATATCVRCPDGLTTNGVSGSVKCEEPLAGGGLGTVRVVAGMWSSDQDPMPGDTGDDGPADQARLNNPTSVTVGACNRLVVADTGNNRLRLITNDGVIRAYAGEAGGGCGFEGDGGPALYAKLCAPTAVRYDLLNQIVFADTGNNRVRRISTSGTIRTVAGTGKPASTGDGGLAKFADLNEPAGIAIDGAGNIFVSEFKGNRVRRIDAATEVITTVAGTGVAGYSGDNGLAVDARLNKPKGLAIGLDGSLYIGDLGNRRIRRVDLATGIITAFAGNGGSGTSGDGGDPKKASLVPYGMVVDQAGKLVFADLSKIRQIDTPEGTEIRARAGSGEPYYPGDPVEVDNLPAFEATLGEAVDAAVDWDGTLYFVDRAMSLLRKVVVV